MKKSKKKVTEGDEEEEEDKGDGEGETFFGNLHMIKESYGWMLVRFKGDN